MNDRDRIEYLMNLYELTPSQFSDKTGIQRASVSHILSNRNKPSLEIMLKIYHTFPEVELSWLVAGEGNPPTLSAKSDDIQEAEAINKADEVQQSQNLLFSFMEDAKLPADDKGVNARVDTVLPKGGDGAEERGIVEKEVLATDGSGGCNKRGVAFSFDVDTDKRIKEIKVFYNNGTYETFLPEK